MATEYLSTKRKSRRDSSGSPSVGDDAVVPSPPSADIIPTPVLPALIIHDALEETIRPQVTLSVYQDCGPPRTVRFSEQGRSAKTLPASAFVNARGASQSSLGADLTYIEL
jgi:hypothetical protein